MKALLAATIINLSSNAFTPVDFQSAVNQALDEAKAFLTPCYMEDKADLKTCDDNQVEFLDAYVRAKGGDKSAMAEVWLVLAPQNSAEPLKPGLRHDHLQGCAWLEIVGMFASDEKVRAFFIMEFRARCARDTLEKVEAIGRRADELLAELRTNPAPPLPWPPPHGPRLKLD